MGVEANREVRVDRGTSLISATVSLAGECSQRTAPGATLVLGHLECWRMTSRRWRNKWATTVMGVMPTSGTRRCSVRLPDAFRHLPLRHSHSQHTFLAASAVSVRACVVRA